MRKLLLIAALFAVACFAPGNAALAGGCGPGNPNCIVTTMPLGDASNRAASDAFVQNAITNLGSIVNSVCGLTGAVTAAQVTACLNTFTPNTQGMVPASGGSSTALFLNQAGGFSSPVAGSNGQVQANVGGVFGGLTNTQLTALINPFSATLPGAVPASGGSSTSLFLNQAGSFSSPTAATNYQPVYNIAAYGAVPDYHESAALSSSGASVTATGSPFTSGMVGDLIAVTGAGAAAAPYFGTIASFVNANSITVSPATSTNVSGVYGQFCIDNTAFVQAAINAARTATLPGGTIQVPTTGTYCITQLDFTNSPPITLKGAANVNGSRFMPMTSANSVMDWTGTSSVNIDGISVGLDHQVAVPKYGLVMSPSSINPGIDFNHLNNVFWTGRYQFAAWYNDRTASSSCYKSSFLNYFQGSPSTGFTAIFTHNNIFSFSSAFATTYAGGAENMSDWNFTGCELHAISSGGGVGAFSALYLDNTLDLSWFGGNIATSNACLVTIAPGTTTNTLMQGVTFYADVGTAPVNVFCGVGTINRTGVYFAGINYSGATVNAGTTSTNFVQAP